MEDIEKAYIAAHTEYSNPLFRYCYFKVSDRDVAKDLVQETFMKTWRYISEGQKIGNLKAFLYKTLNHLIIDEYRKKKTVSLEVLQESGFEPRYDEHKKFEDFLDGERAINLLKKLPDLYRETVFMRYVEELSLSEIAKITGESENAIAVRVHRGLKKLKEIIPYEE